MSKFVKCSELRRKPIWKSRGLCEHWREDKMGGGGGRGGGKFSSDFETPFGRIVPQNGILGADDIPLKVVLG